MATASVDADEARGGRGIGGHPPPMAHPWANLGHEEGGPQSTERGDERQRTMTWTPSPSLSYAEGNSGRASPAFVHPWEGLGGVKCQEIPARSAEAFGRRQSPPTQSEVASLKARHS